MNITKTFLIFFTLISLTINSQSDIEWGKSRAYKGGSPDWIVGKLKIGYVLYGRDYVKRKPINVIYNFDNEMVLFARTSKEYKLGRLDLND